MPGPALTPIANIAPVAPPKGPDTSSQDAASQCASDQAGTGFASELKRQMQASPPSEDPQRTETDSDAAARADAAEQAQPPVQPELAALLGGLLPAAALPATEFPGSEARPATSPDDAAEALSTDTLPGGSFFALSTPLTPEAVTKAPTGNPAAPTAESAAFTAANLAATSGKSEDISLHGAPAAPADTALRTTEIPVAATPTNSFAAMHAAALANLQGAAPPPAPAPVPMHVATPAGSPGWPEEVGNRVSWMVGQAESHAELTLTPPQLGKVEVSITVSGDQTSAQFVAATPAARELIEQSLPRLREILEQSGISLGQTDVGTSGQPGDPERSPRGSNWRTHGNADEGLAANAVPAQWARRGEGLVDTFA